MRVEQWCGARLWLTSVLMPGHTKREVISRELKTVCLHGGGIRGRWVPVEVSQRRRSLVLASGIVHN